ncbi:MAG TPA: hypothetical protein VKU86_15010, partial [Acidimicrobiales bacterium]|nr:hypothetical protein [Acidimicrobiales bacterium]
RDLPLGDFRTGRRSLEDVYMESTTGAAAAGATIDATEDGDSASGAPGPGDDTHVGGGRA